MTDAEIMDRLRALDGDDDADLTTWECEFLDNVLYGPGRTRTFSEKQRAVALELIEKATATPQTTRRLPPGTEKYFRRDA